MEPTNPWKWEKGKNEIHGSGWSFDLEKKKREIAFQRCLAF